MANTLVTNLGSGGMNTHVSPFILKDNECELILNYTLDKIGNLTKRNGYDVFANQPVAGKNILGMHMFNDTSGSEDNALMVANNAGNTNSVIYEHVAGTWTSRDTSSTASVKTRFVTFLDYVFRVNGSNTVLTSADLSTWGTTNAPATITPSFAAVFQDRVYVARNGASQASRVFFSSLPTTSGTITWDTTNDQFDVNPDDGDELTALENNGNRLLMFKNRAMYRWTFGQQEPDRIIGIGTSSQECVKTNFDLGVTFFANKTGVYAYTGGRPKLISRKIQEWFDAISATDVSNFVAEVDADHYYIYLTDSVTIDMLVEKRTYTNVMAVYTISLDAWTIYTLHTPWRASGRFIVSSEEAIYFGSSNGRTYKFNSGTSDDSGGASGNTAVSIKSEIVTKEHLLNFPEGTRLEYIDVISRRAVSSTVDYQLDREGDFISVGQVIGKYTPLRVGRECNSVRVRVSDNSSVASVIVGYNIEHTPLQRRTKNVEQGLLG